MAEIIPFKGVLYNPKRVKGSDVTAPPYDIVTTELKDILYQKSPHNIIRLDFGKDMPGDDEKKNRYTRASRLLRQWLKTGIFIEDKRPAFYCYETVYKINKEEKKLRGFLCAVKIEGLGKGSIYPHEMTRSKPKADRLNILRKCRANLSPIFSLYSSKERVASSILESAAKGRALVSSKNGDDFVHRLYKINDKASVEAIKKELADKHIFIADGHHRYETALEFRNEMSKKGQGLRVKGQEPKPWDYVLMFLANMEDEGS
ncbi:MAG: DUF1015 domain-containing protein [Nitrospirae bacterium]|nr:DUF1015 domain-containing protein [Nitrospirota bacterium]